LFIKNLENVQGDERDVILFSVGYGPDKSGNVSMNFGPLNNDGGERRLNVAVSRSRYEMIVYSTMRADQIDLKRSSAKGVEGLKRFLEFAANGTMNIPQSAISTAEESKLVNLVAKELEEHGYQVQTNVGRSNFKIDIAVVDPDDEQNYMLGILCDGKNYYETKTTRDREIVQPNVLNSLKWEVMRVWSVDWYENKEKVVSRILERIEGIRNKTLPPDVPVEETKPKAFNVEDEEKIDVAGTESAAYRHASFGNVPPKFSFDSATQNRIKEIVRQLVTEEQPVTHSYVKRRMADLMHMENPWRLDSLINDVLETCSCKWYPDLKQTTIFATEEDRANYEGHRSLEGREIEEIPIEELANAMHYLVEQQVSVPTKELKRLTAHLVGKALRGKDLMNCLDTAIEMLKASGKIVERNETLSLA
jgi:very-short-patch-repair endonuclease